MVLSIILVVVCLTTTISLYLSNNKLKELESNLMLLNSEKFSLIKENIKLKDKIKTLETTVNSTSQKEITVKLENNVSKEETKNTKKQNKNNKK